LTTSEIVYCSRSLHNSPQKEATEQLTKGLTPGGKITLVDALKYKLAHILGINISCGPVIFLGNVAQPLA
jgi:hypothetical protein